METNSGFMEGPSTIDQQWTIFPIAITHSHQNVSQREKFELTQISRSAKNFFLFNSPLDIKQLALPSPLLKNCHFTDRDYHKQTKALMSLSPQKFALSTHCYYRIKTEDFEVFSLLRTSIHVIWQYNPSVVSWVKFADGRRCIIYVR